MTGSSDFDLVAVGSRGVPAFEVVINGSIGSGYQRPARLASPGSRGDDCFKIVSEVEHLRLSHESGLLRGQVGCEVLMKPRRIEVRETVCCLLYRTRLARSLGKRFPSSASFSPASGMWAAMYTKPATDESVPASLITAPRSYDRQGCTVHLVERERAWW
jgi:hypothetical protein